MEVIAYTGIREFVKLSAGDCEELIDDLDIWLESFETPDGAMKFKRIAPVGETPRPQYPTFEAQAAEARGRVAGIMSKIGNFRG